MKHIEEFVLQAIAENRTPGTPEDELHLAECPECRSSLETYRFMALEMAKPAEIPFGPHFAAQVMNRITSWEERRAYWKEWMWIWIGSFAGLLATIIFTLMPASSLQFERLAEWSSLIRERGSLVGEQVMILVGSHFHLIILALVIILAFELFDKRLIRRVHAGVK